jgi:hypothetical protein
LNFTAGGPTAQTINLEVVGSGRASILMATAAPDCMGDPAVIVTPWSAACATPASRANYNPTWPHYSPVDDWTGGSGVNRADGPFHDNSVVPDRAQIAFLQGTSAISQLLTGLEPGKNHWLQVRYNARNCCGGETPDMTVSIDGTALGTEAAIQPSGGVYYFRNFEFVPTMDTALLEISTKPNAGGDSTLLIDAVTVIQRDAGNVVSRTPASKPAASSRSPAPSPDQRISGWQGEGTFGLNLSGDPFADNGITPHETWSPSSRGSVRSANPDRPDPGETYRSVSPTTRARATNRTCWSPPTTAVLLDVDVDPVGNASYHQASASFLADQVRPCCASPKPPKAIKPSCSTTSVSSARPSTSRASNSHPTRSS